MKDKIEDYEYKHKIDDSELVEIGANLAHVSQEEFDFFEERRSVYAGFKERADSFKERRKRLTEEYNSGYRKEVIKVRAEPHPESGEAWLYKAGTNIRMGSRPITEEERQASFKFEGINDPEESVSNAKAFLKKKGKDVENEGEKEATDGRIDLFFFEGLKITGWVDWQEYASNLFGAVGNIKTETDPAFETTYVLDRDNANSATLADAFNAAILDLKDRFREISDDMPDSWNDWIADVEEAILSQKLESLVSTATEPEQTEPEPIGDIESGESFPKNQVKEVKIKFDKDLDFGAVIKVAQDEGEGFHFGYRIASSRMPKYAHPKPVFVDSDPYEDYNEMLQVAADAMIERLNTDPKFQTMTIERRTQITQTIEAFCGEEQVQAVAAD